MRKTAPMFLKRLMSSGEAEYAASVNTMEQRLMKEETVLSSGCI